MVTKTEHARNLMITAAVFLFSPGIFLSPIFVLASAILTYQGNTDMKVKMQKATGDLERVREKYKKKFYELKKLDNKDGENYKEVNENEFENLLKKFEPEMSEKVKKHNKYAKILSLLLFPALIFKISANLEQERKDVPAMEKATEEMKAKGIDDLSKKIAKLQEEKKKVELAKQTNPSQDVSAKPEIEQTNKPPVNPAPTINPNNAGQNNGDNQPVFPDSNVSMGNAAQENDKSGSRNVTIPPQQQSQNSSTLSTGNR